MSKRRCCMHSNVVAEPTNTCAPSDLGAVRTTKPGTVRGPGPIKIQSRLKLSKSAVVLTSSRECCAIAGYCLPQQKSRHPVLRGCRSSFHAMRLLSKQRRIFPALHKPNAADREVYLAGVHLNNSCISNLVRDSSASSNLFAPPTRGDPHDQQLCPDDLSLSYVADARRRFPGHHYYSSVVVATGPRTPRSQNGLARCRQASLGQGFLNATSSSPPTPYPCASCVSKFMAW